MTSNEIKALLLNKYAPPAWALFTEVANSTGGGAGYADAVGYSLYPSTGHPVEGFEIKVSRSDWLNELKQPAKAFPVMQYCDKWWLVAPKDVAKLEEIPKAWGFYEVVNGKFFKRKHAPDREVTPMSPSFIASLLRRATESSVPRSTVNDQIAQAVAGARLGFQKDIDESTVKLKGYRDRVEEFERASGLNVLTNYKGAKEVGDAVQFVLNGGLNSGWDLQSALRDVEHILHGLKRYEKMVQAFPKPKV